MGKLKGMVPFLSEAEIERLTTDLARQIEKDFQGKELVLVCPLKGSVIFCSDLMRKLSLPVLVDFVHLTSPKGESVRILKDLSENIFQKHVLIVEEIIDAGRTLSFLRDRIAASFPASLKIVTLLDKPSRRELPIRPDYVGKTIDDRYLIGYGLDSEEIGRNYRDIYNFAQ
jgi:hypoxanthine phosphoribosyltransferase